MQRDQRHAYYAAVSYVDEHVGALLDRLDAERLDGSTIVVMHSDHGYALGEHGVWEKKSNFDLAVRAAAARQARRAKRRARRARSTASLTELVDVMPTLAALAGTAATSRRRRHRRLGPL